MRDAILAAVTLNIFNSHADGIVMANIAQMVNVLQAVVLTEGEKMLLTPTYHVFDLYKEHQDATLLDSYVEAREIGVGDQKVPSLHQSASVDAEGRVHVTVANLSATESQEIELCVSGKENASVSVRLLAGAMGDHNTFEAPETIKPQNFTGFERCGSSVKMTLPVCSVAAITLE